MAIGQYGVIMMGTAGRKEKDQLIESGNNTHERLVEFPFWEEYADLIKSDIADVKNIGGKAAGSITAGKFLEKFTKYPWMHLDIAGSAYIKSVDSYKRKNATGIGVRLLYDFFDKLVKKDDKQHGE
ncbi:MAG: hypothetical protein COC01_09090 [Bacteroidetes bacterium]|nr:MAG: hypothetical protein COC01_09090 [Bacteroidota bacterium]